MVQAEEYTAADAEVMELMDQHDREKLDDPLSKLEHHTDVMVKKRAQNERLIDLKDDSNAKYKNDYEMNKLLRKNLRCVLRPHLQLHANHLMRPGFSHCPIQGHWTDNSQCHTLSPFGLTMLRPSSA